MGFAAKRKARVHVHERYRASARSGLRERSRADYEESMVECHVSLWRARICPRFESGDMSPRAITADVIYISLARYGSQRQRRDLNSSLGQRPRHPIRQVAKRRKRESAPESESRF